ncbi:hypothetical protein D3C86_1664830 [compost metagenome]
MLAVPTATAVTMPAVFTVAIAGSEDVQTTVLLLAFRGAIVAFMVVVSPTPTVAAGLFNATVVINTFDAVTTLLAVLPPSCVVTVTVAVPGAIPVSTPF